MKRTLLAVFAHPDDESFGPGGTLAKYADEGVDVHIAIATDGVAGSVAEGQEEALTDLVAVRRRELETAVQILGGTLHLLNYRDSGYIGDPANNHPDAFINSNEEEAVGKVVKLIRELRPQVVITHDETGGYFHPDHIHCCKITTAAFFAVADPQKYPEFGLPVHKPERLYYSAFSNRWVKVLIFLLRLRRKDPTKMGRNKDIDFTRLGVEPGKIHAIIDYRRYWDVKKAASAQHASQGGGAGSFRVLPEFLQKQFMGKDTYIRAYPPVADGFRETDLFPNDAPGASRVQPKTAQI